MKKLFYQLITLLFFMVSILLTMLFRHSSFFTIMLLWSICLALLGKEKLAVISSVVSLVTAMVITFGVLQYSFQMEFVFVVLVWFFIILILVKFKALYREIADQARQLKEKNEFYSRVMEVSPYAIIITDMEGRIVESSRRHLELLKIDDFEVIRGKDVFAFIASEDQEKARENMTKVLEEGILRNSEYKVLHIDGTSFDCNLSVSLLHDADGNPSGFMGILRDITQENDDKRNLKKFAEDRERLAHEVQHRVKNHMNTIRSLFMLQRNSLGISPFAEEVKDVLVEAENRVTVMMNLYQKLSDTPLSDKVDLKEYLLGVIRDIEATLAGSKEVKVQKNIPMVMISVHQALPIAIMVNELITNAFKYAFGKKEQGIIAVTIEPTDSDKLLLTVRDDGKGVPGDAPDKGFGLSIVEGYAQQFGGELKIETDVGFTVSTVIRLDH